MQATWVACLFEYFTRGGGGEIFAFVLAAFGQQPLVVLGVIRKQDALWNADSIKLEGDCPCSEDEV